MSATAAAGHQADPYQVGRGSEGPHPSDHAERTPDSKRIIVGYGFWIFLLSDIIMFSAFFAAFAVLMDQTAGGPRGSQLFDPVNAAVETACLLASSFTCGVAGLAVRGRSMLWFVLAMGATFVLGTAFLGLELQEFVGLVQQGAGPSRSAFLSSFFALVGCHGMHVGLGLLWLLTMIAQVFAKGFRQDILHRMLCFGLFWHALDIIWVGVLTVVYLMGSGA